MKQGHTEVHAPFDFNFFEGVRKVSNPSSSSVVHLLMHVQLSMSYSGPRRRHASFASLFPLPPERSRRYGTGKCTSVRFHQVSLK